MKFEIALEALICADEACTDEQAADAAADIMEALVDMGVEDPFVGGSLKARRFEVTLLVDGDSEYDAFISGNDLIIEAFRRAGVQMETSVDVEHPPTWLQKSVRPAAAV